MTKKEYKQSLGEEISNAISHGVGALLAIVGTIILIIATVNNNYGAIDVVSSALYGASLIILYTFSCIYHALADSKGKRVLRVFDHCSIFFLILGTYTPICLTIIKGALGWWLFGVNCVCAVLGIVLNSIDLKRWEKLSMFLYIVMGWLVIFSIRPLLKIISLNDFMILLYGGIAYTAGIYFYKSRRFKYAHFIWHIFVLAGSVIHYFFILSIICSRH